MTKKKTKKDATFLITGTVELFDLQLTSLYLQLELFHLCVVFLLTVGAYLLTAGKSVY